MSPGSSADFHHGSESPTMPGAYWFQSETMARLVEVRLTNGELTVWWPPSEDQPLPKLKGHWRGPIPPSSGPGSR